MNQAGKNHPEKDPQQAEDQRGQAGQLVGDRIEIQRQHGEQAEKTQDPSGSEPMEGGVPVQEQ